MVALWHYNSVTDFHVNLVIETPFKGIEKSEVASSVVLFDNNARVDMRVFLHPIDFNSYASIKDKDLIIWVASKFKETR